MSDKNKYNKDLMDKGWADMSAILDREMPVKKKKRRYPFFLILGFLCLGSFGAIWFSINNEGTMEQESIVQILSDEKSGTIDNAEIKNSTESKKNSINHEIINSENLNKREEVAAINNDIVQSKIIEEKNNPNVLVSNNYNLNYSKKQLREINLNNYNKGNDEIIIEKIEGRIPLKKYIDSHIESVEDDGNEKIDINTNDENKNESKSLEPIALLENVSLGFTEDEFKLDINKINKGQWKFGIEGAFVFQDKNDKGARLGFVANREINKKWSLQTGLELNSQFVNYSKKSVEALLDELGIGNMGSGISPIGITENYSATVIKINSYYLKIPLMIGYKINPSFELTGGAMFSSQFYSNSSLNLNPVDSFADLNGEEFFYNKINPDFELQGSFGMMYYPKSKWGIGLRYDHGFANREITLRGNTNDIQELELKGYQRKTRQISLSTRFYF